jgi:hypothetical protein
MAVMMVMGEMAMATATATAMMLPLLPTATMSMTMMAAIQGRRLDNSNLTTMMG